MSVRILWLVLATTIAVNASGVKVRFDPASPNVGPFPTDALTIPDPAQKTGLRINMPLPDCGAEPSTCAELALVNQIDGFSLEPRIRVRFSGPVNPDTLRDGIFVLWLNDLTNEEFGLLPFGSMTPINTVMYDPATNTAYAEPDQILSQHRRYALVVTNAVRDTKGDPVEPDPAFLDCLWQQSGYCDALAMAIGRLAPRIAPRVIAGGSVFTTLSATAWMENARAAIQTSNIGFEMSRPQAVFAVGDLAGITWHAQTGVNPPQFRDQPLALGALAGVGRIAFGSFQSPLFLNERLVIPAIPSAANVPLPANSQQIYFHVLLPATPPPAAGYPVVIVGHWVIGNRFDPSLQIAATLAARGFATIAINAFGFGFGPASTLTVTDKSGNVTELPAAGRGVDIDGNGKIAASEGCLIMAGAQPVAYRDCFRQTSLDLMQLVRAIRAGVDLTGHGAPDLDGSQIYYFGISLGAMYGAIFNAVEPDIPAAVLTVGGGSLMDVARSSPVFRAVTIATLGNRQPVLLNRPGPDFDMAWPLRYRPVRIIDVPGAIPIQEFMERIEWIDMPGDPLAYAPHLRWSTLAGVPIKRILFHVAIGDMSIPNPCNTNLIRAANMVDAASVYRHDLALAAAADLPRDPHGFAFFAASPAGEAIARAAQAQIAEFLAGRGLGMPDVNFLVRPLFGQGLFEVRGLLPEDFSY